MFDLLRRRPVQLFAAEGAAADAKPRPVRSWPTQRGSGGGLAPGGELIEILRARALDEEELWQKLRERAHADDPPAPQALIAAGGRELTHGVDDRTAATEELWVTSDPAPAPPAEPEAEDADLVDPAES